MPQKRIFLLLLVLLLHFLVLPVQSTAGRLQFTPSISAKTGYDDNILFNFSDTISDTYFSFKPEIEGNYGSEALQFGLNAYVDAYRYLQETDLNVENYWVECVGNYLATPRLSVTGKASYLKDTTLDSELEETGRVARRENRNRYRGIVEATYELNEISGIELEYEFTQTLYEGIQGEETPRLDRTVHSLTIPVYRWINYRMDRLSLEPSYTRAETEDNVTTDYYNLSLGWIHIFNDTLIFRGRAGYGYTVQTDGDQENVNNIGNANLSLTKSGETTSLRGGYRSEIRLNSIGEIIEVDRLYLRLGKRITERFRFNFYGSIYASRPVDEFETVDRWYYDLKPEVMYQLTENLSSSLFYRYSQEYNNELEDNPDRDRSIVELRLDYRINFEK